VQLDQDDVDRICQLVVDHGLNTAYIAERYDISRRRVQQLASESSIRRPRDASRGF
jgi:DNA-binding transcriptional regulator LsrR (DeoR family)